jgi:glycosyltransferase involved in cell wall biosynthesis
VTAEFVSVVIPAFDAERFVEEAIRSALDQTTPPDEIIVVDDGSADETAAIADSIDERVTVLRGEHRGQGPSRNAGIAVANGDFIAFLDADDVWLPRKLERQRAAFAADRDLDAVFCLGDEFLDGVDPESGGVRAPRTAYAASLPSSALLRRELVDRVGAFASVQVRDWIQWWGRARSLGVREYLVPEVLVRRRIHGNNNSLVRRGEGQTLVEIARTHLQDLRALRTSATEGRA